MDTEDFDDRNVCETLTDPTFLVELWSWDLDEQGESRNTWVRTCVLSDCDVRAALSWCEQNEPSPGTFVLYAGKWTTLGFLSTMWLTGYAPDNEANPRSAGPSRDFYTS